MDDQQTIGFQKEKFDSTKELQLHKFAHKIGFTSYYYIQAVSI